MRHPHLLTRDVNGRLTPMSDNNLDLNWAAYKDKSYWDIDREIAEAEQEESRARVRAEKLHLFANRKQLVDNLPGTVEDLLHRVKKLEEIANSHTHAE